MEKKPNVIVLFSDQQRHDTISCYGQPLGGDFKLTPNIDRLAERGTRFEYAFTCQPVCGPARACIQTGRYATELGCHINDKALPLDQKTIANYFNDCGYETAYVGKWHLASHDSSLKQADSLDYTVTAIPEQRRGGYKDYWVAADVLEFTSHGYDGFMFDEDNQKREFKGYRVDCTTDFVLEYLKKPKTSPFFLFVSYIEPHHQNDRNCYEGPIGSKEKFKNFSVPKDLEGQKGDYMQHLPDYLGCCESLDKNVGRIVAQLEKQGILDNTVIMYTCDHATHFKTRNSEYKRSCHDNSIRIPMVVAGPGFEGGNVITEMAGLIDIPPTLLAAADLAIPKDMRGTPLQQLVKQPQQPIHEEMFIQISESCIGRALRTKQYTYCVEAPITDRSDLVEKAGSSLYIEKYLYDNDQDPYQLDNLILDNAYLSLKSTLKEKLKKHIWDVEGIEVTIKGDTLNEKTD